MKLTSQDFFSQWQKQLIAQDVFDRKLILGGQISLAYIDGNYDYNFVKDDFEGVNQNLEVGGFILCDDSAEDSGWEVNKFVKEICRNSQYKVIRNQPNYFFSKN